MPVSVPTDEEFQAARETAENYFEILANDIGALAARVAALEAGAGLAPIRSDHRTPVRERPEEAAE